MPTAARTIRALIVLAFLVYDIAWAYPPHSGDKSTLNTPSSFNNPIDDGWAATQDAMRCEALLLQAVSLIGRLLLPDRNKDGIHDLTLDRLSPLLKSCIELREVSGSINPDRIKIGIVKDGMLHMLAPKDEIPYDAIVFIPREIKTGEGETTETLITIVRRGDSALNSVQGTELPSDAYIIKEIPVSIDNIRPDKKAGSLAETVLELEEKVAQCDRSPVEAPLRDEAVRVDTERVAIVQRMDASNTTLGGMTELYPMLIASLSATFPKLKQVDIYNAPYPELIPKDPRVQIHGQFEVSEASIDVLRNELPQNKPDLILMVGIGEDGAPIFDAEDHIILQNLRSVPRIDAISEHYRDGWETRSPVYYDSESIAHRISSTVEPSVNTPEQVRGILGAMGLEVPAYPADLIRASGATEESVRNLLGSLGVGKSGKPVIFVNPHGSVYRKLLDHNEWAAIIADLINKGYEVVLRSANGKWNEANVDKRMAEAVLSAMDADIASQVKVFEPKNLDEVVAILDDPVIGSVLSVQTGIGHLALRKKPTVIVAGQDKYWLPGAEDIKTFVIVDGNDRVELKARIMSAVTDVTGQIPRPAAAELTTDKLSFDTPPEYVIDAEDILSPGGTLSKFLSTMRMIYQKNSFEEMGDVIIYGGAVREEIYNKGKRTSDFDLLIRPTLSGKEIALPPKDAKKLLHEKADEMLRIISREFNISSSELSDSGYKAKFEDMPFSISCYVNADGAAVKFSDGRTQNFTDLSVCHAYLSVADGRIYDFRHGQALADIRSRRARFVGASGVSPVSLSVIMRAIRFIFQYGLTADPETDAIIREFFAKTDDLSAVTMGSLSDIPGDKIDSAVYGLFDRIISHARDPEAAMRFLREVDKHRILGRLSEMIEVRMYTQDHGRSAMTMTEPYAADAYEIVRELLAVESSYEMTNSALGMNDHIMIGEISALLERQIVRDANRHIVDILREASSEASAGSRKAIESLISELDKDDGTFDQNNPAYQAVVSYVRSWPKRHYHAHVGESIHEGFTWNRMSLYSGYRDMVLGKFSEAIDKSRLSPEDKAERMDWLISQVAAGMPWHELDNDKRKKFILLFKECGAERNIAVCDLDSWRDMITHVALENFSDGVTDLRLMVNISRKFEPDIKRVVKTAMEGLERAEKLVREAYKQEFHAAIVPSFARQAKDNNPENVGKIVDALIELRAEDPESRKRIVGIDISGAEAVIDHRRNTHYRKTSDFRAVLNKARADGMLVMSHLGDWGNTSKAAGSDVPNRPGKADRRKELSFIEDPVERVRQHLRFIADGIREAGPLDAVLHGTALAPRGSVITKDPSKHGGEPLAGQAISDERNLAAIDRLLQSVKDSGAEVMTCPTANVNSQKIALYRGHPIYQWLARGIKVSINADDLYWGKVRTTLSDDIAKFMLASPRQRGSPTVTVYMAKDMAEAMPIKVTDPAPSHSSASGDITDTISHYSYVRRWDFMNYRYGSVAENSFKDSLEYRKAGFNTWQDIEPEVIRLAGELLGREGISALQRSGILDRVRSRAIDFGTGREALDYYGMITAEIVSGAARIYRESSDLDRAEKYLSDTRTPGIVIASMTDTYILNRRGKIGPAQYYQSPVRELEEFFAEKARMALEPESAGAFIEKTIPAAKAWAGDNVKRLGVILARVLKSAADKESVADAVSYIDSAISREMIAESEALKAVDIVKVVKDSAKEVISDKARDAENGQYNVVDADIFGSAAEGSVTPESDIDLIIVTRGKDFSGTEEFAEALAEKLFEKGIYLNISPSVFMTENGEVFSGIHPEMNMIGKVRRPRGTIIGDKTIAEISEMLHGSLNNRMAETEKLAGELRGKIIPKDGIANTGMDSPAGVGPTAERMDRILDVLNMPEAVHFGPDAERLTGLLGQFEADGLVASMIALAWLANERGEKIVVGIEDGWMRDPREDSSGLKRDAVNPLLTEIGTLSNKLRDIGLDSLEIIVENGEELKRSILTANGGNSLKNVIIMASQDTVNSDCFTCFREAAGSDRPFIASVNCDSLRRWYDSNTDTSLVPEIEVMKLLSITLDLALGKTYPGLPNYNNEQRTILFILPEPKIISYHQAVVTYLAKKTVLQAA